MKMAAFSKLAKQSGSCTVFTKPDEAVTSDDAAVKNKKLSVSEGSDRAVTEVFSGIKVFGEPTDLEFKMLLSLHGSFYFSRYTFFPDGFAFTLGSTTYEGTDSGWEIKSPPESLIMFSTKPS